VDETVKDALIREAIALGALALILFAVGPGRTLVPALITRARLLWGGTDPFEAQARQFASEVSRWDHEQAAKPDRRSAGGGPCGCG
jgi:uncharacterized membrane protein